MDRSTHYDRSYTKASTEAINHDPLSASMKSFVKLLGPKKKHDNDKENICATIIGWSEIFNEKTVKKIVRRIFSVLLVEFILLLALI